MMQKNRLNQAVLTSSSMDINVTPTVTLVVAVGLDRGSYVSAKTVSVRISFCFSGEYTHSTESRQPLNYKVLFIKNIENNKHC